MKTLPVRFRPEAEADLDEIAHYVVEQSGSIQTALGFLGRIRTRCLSIGDTPLGGVARDDLAAGIRMVPFERSAVILYRITDDAVEIVTIAYGGRDHEALHRQ